MKKIRRFWAGVGVLFLVAMGVLSLVLDPDYFGLRLILPL